jgi:hypothetical protein
MGCAVVKPFGVPAKLQIGLLAATLCCLVSSPSFSETPAEVAAKLSLLGRWSSDCEKPPGMAHYHLNFEAVGGGGVRAWADFGPNQRIHYDDVDRLVSIDRSTFSLRRRRLNNEGRVTDSGWTNTITIEGDRMRTVRTVYRGVVQVDNGIERATGRTLPDLYRCRSKEVPTASLDGIAVAQKDTHAAKKWLTT